MLTHYQHFLPEPHVVLSGGVYTVTGTDGNGCTNTSSRTVIVHPLPTVTISSNPGLTLCQGNSTTLTANGAFTYVWSNGAQTSNINVSVPGVYSVTGTSSNGCTSTSSVTVVVNTPPSVNILSNPGLTICNGETTTLTATAANSYVWNTGAITASINVTTAGIYSVTGTNNNGCTGSATVIVVVNPLPSVSISSNPGLTVCQGETSTLIAAGATSYLWNTGANTAAIVVNTSGTYTVTGTSLNGCTSTSEVVVVVNPLPPVTISSNPGLTICQGLSTTLTANGALSYVWSTGDVGSTISVNTAGVYSVTGTDINGCTNTASRTVVVNPLPIVTISSNPGLTICQDVSTSLNASGASSYVWSNGDQTSTINVSLAGVYTVTGTSANGCTSSANVTVVVNPNPVVNILSNPGLTICNGESTTLTAINASTYVWNTGATTTSISVTTPGIYSVTGTDNNGCTGSATVVVVVNALPTVTIFSNPGLNICTGESTTLIAGGANSYIWNTGAITSQITVNLSGMYSVTGTAVNGCTASALVTVVVSPNPAVNILSNPGLTICQGNNTTLTANGAVSYVWSTGDVAASINVTVAGTYIVTGTDANGCTGTASRTVVVNPSPTVSITSNPGLTICQGESTTLTALGANSYIWSNGEQVTSISVSTGGTYVVTGTAANGCTGTFSVIVTVNSAPTVTIASNPGLTICSGQNTLITALGANSYIWNNGFTSSSLTINTAGTYSVTGTGPNGCTNSASVTVIVNPLPPVNVLSNPGLTICNGGSTTLTAVGATSYVWSNGSVTQSINVNIAGTYTVTGTDVNGCTNTASRTVVINPNPAVSILSNPGLTICTGGTTTLTASGALNYVWNTGEVGATITVNIGGVYTVTGTDINGCTTIASRTVVVNPPPAITISSNPGLTICNGSSTLLNALGASTYVWSNGANGSSITANTGGVYTVTGTDNNGCTNTASVLKIKCEYKSVLSSLLRSFFKTNYLMRIFSG